MLKHKVLSLKHLNESTYIIRIERNGLQFNAGQYVTLGLMNQESREYSIYSGEQDDFLEFLIKEIDDGNISKKIKLLDKGTYVLCTSPKGSFLANKNLMFHSMNVYIATGTGIAPFYSLIKSFPNIKYNLIHGVRYNIDFNEDNFLDLDKYVMCCSRECKEGVFNGRVTDYLNSTNLRTNANYYLCGNSNMIHDVFHILVKKGISSHNIYSEEYF